jgi:hypothetical protein
VSGYVRHVLIKQTAHSARTRCFKVRENQRSFLASKARRRPRTLRQC